MKSLLMAIVLVSFASAFAADSMKMNYSNEEILKIIEQYSKLSGQKFVVDPGVRGRISIFIQEAVPKEEAFNQLSTALAINGFAISKQGDTMVVMSARNIQRSMLEVGTQLPALKPERMITWVYTVKNIPAMSVNHDLRILTSKDGELSVTPTTNQIIITDWASNVQRVAEILKEVDKPVDAATAKLVQAGKNSGGEAPMKNLRGAKNKKESE